MQKELTSAHHCRQGHGCRDHRCLAQSLHIIDGEAEAQRWEWCTSRSLGKLVAEPSFLPPVLLSLLIWCHPVNSHGSLCVAFTCCSLISPEVWAGRVGPRLVPPALCSLRPAHSENAPHELTVNLFSLLAFVFLCTLRMNFPFKLPFLSPALLSWVLLPHLWGWAYWYQSPGPPTFTLGFALNTPHVKSGLLYTGTWTIFKEPDAFWGGRGERGQRKLRPEQVRKMLVSGSLEGVAFEFLSEEQGPGERGGERERCSGFCGFLSPTRLP